MSFLYAQLPRQEEFSNTHRGVEAGVLGTQTPHAQAKLLDDPPLHHKEKADEEDEYDFHDNEPNFPSLILSKILHL